jgi:hypothetical protein
MTSTVSPVYKLYKTPVKTTFRVWCLYSYLVYDHRAPFSLRTLHGSRAAALRESRPEGGPPLVGGGDCVRADAAQQALQVCHFFNTENLRMGLLLRFRSHEDLESA